MAKKAATKSLESMVSNLKGQLTKAKKAAAEASAASTVAFDPSLPPVENMRNLVKMLADVRTYAAAGANQAIAPPFYGKIARVAGEYEWMVENYIKANAL